MLAEYYALTRLIHALGRWELHRISIWLAAVFLVGTALALIQPERIYEDLLKPSLITLWLSQLFVFAWYPRFVRRRHPQWNLIWAIVLGAAGSALMLFGLWTTIQNQLGT
jgi:purine-cytosine permease-like protein